MRCSQGLINEVFSNLEGFADELVMVGKVGPAVDAGVGPVARGKILTESLRHLFEDEYLKEEEMGYIQYFVIV